MKRIFASLSFLGAALWLGLTAESAAGAESANFVARFHFGGFEQLSRSTNGVTLQSVWKLPTTAALRDEALDKIATALVPVLAQGQAGGPETAKQIRPLLNDLLNDESYWEIYRTKNHALDWTVAVRLADQVQAQSWQSRWSQLSFKNVSFTQASSWFVVSSSHGKGSSSEGIVQKIKTGGQPAKMAEGHWLDAEINPSQSQLPGLSSLKEVASLDLALIPRGDNLRSEMHARFGKPQGWKLDPWRPPVDAIKDPLISFTAVQGIASWLNRFKVVQDFGLNPTPNQLFVWGQSPKLMLQIHAALPVPDPTNTLERFRNKEVPTLNALLATNKLGTLEFSTNRPSWITWTGLPVIIPSFHPLPRSDFMTMDIFPLGRTSFTNPVPAALYHQFTSRTNLLWYDWELTGPRVTQLRPLFFLASAVFDMHPLATNSLSHKWLESAEKSLGETVTEVSITSPTELTLIRKSPVGFNGLELFSLALWMDATNFPAINTDFRIRSSLIQHKRPAPFPK